MEGKREEVMMNSPNCMAFYSKKLDNDAAGLS